MTIPARIVDAHVHLWDPSRVDWYPYLAGKQDVGLGDVSGMARHFTAEAYAAEAGSWNVEKLVHVAAATGRYSVAETLELDQQAVVDGAPAAIVGGLPHTKTTSEAIALIDEQGAASRFRGVRPMGRPPIPEDEILTALAERGLLYELLARPSDLLDAARRFADHPETTIVVEHTGWPQSAEPDERVRWLEGIQALAAAGDHVHCKLSGLMMALPAMTADAFRPWIDPAIEVFGIDRCFFASNFPVDGLHGSLDQLWSAYTEVTSDLSTGDVDRLYATNAERLYNC